MKTISQGLIGAAGCKCFRIPATCISISKNPSPPFLHFLLFQNTLLKRSEIQEGLTSWTLKIQTFILKIPLKRPDLLCILEALSRPHAAASLKTQVRFKPNTARQPFILLIQNWQDTPQNDFLKSVRGRKGLPCTTEQANWLSNHKGNLSLKKHNQYFSPPPAWRSKARP